MSSQPKPRLSSSPFLSGPACSCLTKAVSDQPFLGLCLRTALPLTSTDTGEAGQNSIGLWDSG